MDKRYITMKEARELSGLCAHTLRSRVSAGDVRTRIAYGRIVLLRSDVAKQRDRRKKEQS